MDRTGHRSNALFKYEKISEVKSADLSMKRGFWGVGA